MNLPDLDQTVIPKEKITNHLLSPTHPEGGSKAVFFGRFGFRRDDWTTLAGALRAHAAAHEVAYTEPSPFGTRYVVDGIMQTPSGRTPLVRSVWFIDVEGGPPRFVTAYPLKEETP